MKLILSTCSVAGVLCLASPMQAAPMPGAVVTQTGPQTVTASQAIQVEAKVLSVNKKTREINLKTQDGEEITMKAGEDVKNFEKIKKGDLVKVSYLESLTLELKKGDGQALTVSGSSEVVAAQPGQKPGAVVTEKVTARGTVTKVEDKKQTVTVKGPNRMLTLHIQKPEIFKQIKVGDQIEATYTEALAISVESVKK